MIINDVVVDPSSYSSYGKHHVFKAGISIDSFVASVDEVLFCDQA
jgi:hypothetical protein